MADGKSFTKGEGIDKQDQALTQGIKDVYIGVFFDGTSNNMVQKTFFEKTIKKDYGVVRNWWHYEKMEWGKLKKEKILSLKRIINDSYPSDKDIAEFLEIVDGQESLGMNSSYSARRIEEERKTLGTLKERKKNILSNYAYQEIVGLGDDVIAKMDDDEILCYLNAYTSVKPNSTKGYSNVGVLYDFYNLGENKKDNCLYHHFYIEGSGATDLTESGKTSIGGLGFGVNPTGVVGLVSKAVKYSTSYIESVKALFASNNDVTIHFILFGFSRGSTCARLFSHLVTRDKKDSPLECEDEFSKYYAKQYCKKESFVTGKGKNSKKWRVRFLEDYHKVVDFMGIYDTVASMGFLKQKDGYVNPLHILYIANGDYRNNWHYNNVREYGMYINQQKVENVCQIGAMDEFRENFAFVDVGENVPNNAIEIFIPGCHSDIGGGYIDGQEEQEIELNRFSRRKKRTSLFMLDPQKRPKPGNSYFEIEDKYSNNKSSTDSCLLDEIRNEVENVHQIKPLSLESLQELGWVDEQWQDKEKAKKIKIGDSEVRCTIRAVENEKSVLFKRNVKGGYSNIALKMMMKCTEDCGYAFFKYKFSDTFPAYETPKDLAELGKQMIEQVEKPNGQRKWLYPDGNYCNGQYKWLRMNYLHFTCTTIAHVNWVGNDYVRKHSDETFKKAEKVRKNETSMGNIGNPPNFDEEGRLCRIVYHGDPQEVNYKDMTYMYDYESDNVIKVNVNHEW